MSFATSFPHLQPLLSHSHCFHVCKFLTEVYLRFICSTNAKRKVFNFCINAHRSSEIKAMIKILEYSVYIKGGKCGEGKRMFESRKENVFFSKSLMFSNKYLGI